MPFTKLDYSCAAMAFACRNLCLGGGHNEERDLRLLSVSATYNQGRAIAVPGVYSRRKAMDKANG